MDDITFCIFKFLDLHDAFNYSLTNTNNYKIFMHNHLWNYYLETTTDHDTIQNLWNKDYRLTHKRYNELNSIIKKCNLKVTVKELFNSQQLNLRYNQVTTIPQEIGNLNNLQELNLSNNQLTTIPQEIGNLINLRYIHLYNNQLTSIPQEIGNLINLQLLYLHNNQLTTIPQEIKDIPNITIY